MNENIRVPLEIRLKGVHPEAFSIFLTFAYTGEINILPELVPDIMKMSENLRIYSLRMKCLDYMDLLPCNDILLLLANFRETQESEIFVRSMKYVNEKFAEVISCDIFLLLDIETVCFLLSYDHLVACTEMDIFKAGLRWIEFKLQERSRYLERVLECIRLTLMTMDELFLVVRAIQALIADDRGRDIILRANWILTAYILGREDPYKFPEHKVRTELKTTPSSTSEPFYSQHAFLPVDVEIGLTRPSAPSTPQNQNGHAHYPLIKPEASISNARTTRTDKPTSKSSAHALNAKKDSVIRRETKSQVQSDVTPVHRSVDAKTGDIFAVGDFCKYSTDKQNREGGTDPRKSKQSSYDFPTKEAFVYDANTNAWRQIAPMNTARMYHSLCSLYGMIYAIGGQGERKRILNTVECYNPATDNWFFVKSMSVSRIGACAADLDGKLYVAGGTGNTVDNMPGSILSSVECYDPHTNRWSTKHDLRFGRCHANLVKASGRLYLCGGATRTFTRMESTLSSVGVLDVYDQERDVWIPIAQMSTPRHNAGCTVVDDKIYIIGGVSTVRNQILQSVECFDVINDVWMEGISELPYQAQWITCAAVRRSQ
ncbi:hypothetical protein FSP39_015766 [Pinctada imbricata]|uniref:BACK domain-containing protein n=1 Tax=Pinctada imbricata TaxID=66713 RepID=A0AA88YDU6_PINIB|nr:hypothetical protein FSP39_015766 [Pinctada imbricata]